MIGTIQRLKNKKGFTMVELIVVIAIIAVLSAIIIPLSMNYLSDAQVTSANKSAAAIVNAWNIEVNNRALKGLTVANGGFKYDFSNGTVTALGSLPGMTDTEIQSIMKTIFPSQSKGIAAVQIVASSGTVACTAAVFSESAVYANLTFDSASNKFKYGTVDLMTLAAASGAVITPAVANPSADTGSVVFGYSPQPVATTTPPATT